MKPVYVTLAVIFSLMGTGYCLQLCYSCGNRTSQLNSTDQCNQSQVNHTYVLPPLDTSYTTSQCQANQTKIECPCGKNTCARVFRRVEQGSDVFEFENRFCASDDVCNDIEMLCAPGNGTKNIGNATSQC
ncbi:hypothetical protein OS493_003417 [Desmophyllum pertusum]|uniref:Sodefrin-like factor n=1 Tax=Desmophyllum pertusum TaxID=174260 RepID=A0A9X0A619_9CNID|nr:hypothetical protein OS493_003417 [Desmophyllum pertusum]